MLEAEKKGCKDSFESDLKKVILGERERLHVPMFPVKPEDKILGVLESELARDLFSFLREHVNRKDELIKKFRSRVIIDGAEWEKSNTELIQVRERIKILEGLFWAIVHADFPETRSPSNDIVVSIREGWKVVISLSFPKHHPPTVLELLRQMA